MDPQFEQLAKHIADDLEKRLGGVIVKQLGDAEKRLDGVIVKRLGDAEDRLGGVIVKQLGDAEKRLTEQFTAAETRLSEGARVNMEELKSTVKLAAEGYGATLDRIERRLDELNAKVDTKFGDHDKVLMNHASRISRLESSQ
jgi:hypothetical protein